MISQKSKQTDRFALKGLFLSTKHNATANFLQKIIKWKRHFWADALSFTKYQNLQGACSMWRRLKIWNFLGKILFFNIFLLRKWVSKIFKATCFGKNLLISQWLNNLKRKRSTIDGIVSKNSEIFKGRMVGKNMRGGKFQKSKFLYFLPPW